MRFVHLADLHLGRSLAEFSLIELQREILGQIIDYIRHNDVDAVVIAGEALRAELAEHYPETLARIQARREAIAYLGIDLHEDVLPMSNINAAMFPFMLNTGKVFALEEA